jgi:hypothetical protein
VDRALDIYITSMRGRRGIDPSGFRAATLAKMVNVSVADMSTWLQDYRRLQGGRQTRYVVACESYGPRARWKILAKPGSHPTVIEKNHAAHAVWLTSDTFARFMRDIGFEIDPALRGHNPAADAQIKLVMTYAAQQMSNSFKLAQSLLANAVGAPVKTTTP